LFVNGLFLKEGKIKDGNQIALITGTQAEEFATTTTAASGENQKFSFKENDLFIDSASVIPGNEKFVKKLLQEFCKKVSKVVLPFSAKEKMMGVNNVTICDVHSSGHACGKALQELVADYSVHDNVSSFIPMHGTPEKRDALAELAKQVKEKNDLKKLNILDGVNGSVIKVTVDGAEILGVDESFAEPVIYTVPQSFVDMGNEMRKTRNIKAKKVYINQSARDITEKMFPNR
jgi:mRNA degradation ribonuclease J1/J2